jgi:hypothetical protein
MKIFERMVDGDMAETSGRIPRLSVLQARSLRLASSILAPLLFLGCTIPKGDVVSMTQSVIGLRIGENPKTQTPEVQIGFFRSTFQFVPTSTNKVYAPMVNSSLSLDQKAFSTSIDEDFQTGGATSPTNSVAKQGALMRQKSTK